MSAMTEELWWQREIVTPQLKWLGDELCRRTGQPATAAGDKGNEAHDSGSHRSQEWILNSRFCDNRSYTVQSGLSDVQKRHIAGFDFTPGVWGTAENRRRMSVQTGRLLAAMKAGQLEGVRELYGTVDGRTVTGWNNVENRTASSDPSHLDHWHLSLDRRRMTDQALMERVVAIVMGDDMELTDKIALPSQLVKLAGQTQTEATVSGALAYTLCRSLLGQQSDERVEAMLRQLVTAVAADEARDKAVLAAVQALAAAGGVDSAPIIAAIHEVRTELGAEIGRLQGALLSAHTREERLREQLAAAYAAAAAAEGGA